MTNPYHVVGIDPSLAATGIAFPDGSTATIKERKLTGDKRLVLLYASVMKAAEEVDMVVIEDLPTNAMGSGLTGRSQGVVRLALQQLGVPYIEIPPATLKKAATGKGNAKKSAMREAMEAAIKQELPKSTDDNQVDAWYLREIGLYLLGLSSHVYPEAAPNLEQYKEKAAVIQDLMEEWSGTP